MAVREAVRGPSLVAIIVTRRQYKVHSRLRAAAHRDGYRVRRMKPRPSFDVFISYSRSDAAVVERLAGLLRSQPREPGSGDNLRVFFDRDYLAAGQSWPERLEKQLADCGAVAVCIGPTGLGPVQKREQYIAIDRKARDESFPVIPVLLPGANDPPLGFLRLNTWIDLRRGVDQTDQLEIFGRAIRGLPPAENCGGMLLRPTICPYRGLDPFREEDATLFFGRETFIRTLIDKIGRKSLTAVVGASGSGKSSIVLAGLVPALRGKLGVTGAKGQVWEIGIMRPGTNPLQQLAAAFLPLAPGLDEFERIKVLKQRADNLASGHITLAEVVQRTIETQPGTERLLLIVDQFEELFTQTKDAGERADFLLVLLRNADDGPLSVVLTLRGDFFGRVLENRAFADRLQDAVVNIGPMQRSELERAIVEPARQVGLHFEDGLVEHILDEVGSEPGNLPLLEFLLSELWNTRERDARMSFAAYRDAGGIRKAIAARADREFDNLSDEAKAAARRFLVRLVAPGEGREDTRTRMEIPDADPAVGDLVRHFADARLLTTGLDEATGRQVVEVSHEALIRGWATLRDWVNQDREFLRTVQRVKAAQRAWNDEQEDKESRLLPPSRGGARAPETA
jgi:hypothetical protein